MGSDPEVWRLGWWLGRGPRHASACVCFWKNFLSYVLAQFALGIWCIFSVSSYLAVFVPGVWVLLMSLESWIFRQMSLSMVQCLVRQWIHALRQYSGGFGRISHIFYDAADSNPEAFSPFGRMEKCAQLMLLVAVLLRAVRTWKTGRTFRELCAWLTPVMMGWFFRRSVRHFFRPPLRS